MWRKRARKFLPIANSVNTSKPVIPKAIIKITLSKNLKQTIKRTTFVHVVHVWVQTCVSVCLPLYVPVETRGPHLVSCHCPSYFLRQSLTEFKVHCFGYAGWPSSSRHHTPCPRSEVIELRVTISGFYMYSGGPNSGRHTHTTETSLQLAHNIKNIYLLFILFVLEVYLCVQVFACLCICASCACLAHKETRRGHHIPCYRWL